MILNYIQWWGSISVDYGDVQSPFVAVTPESILTRRGIGY